MRKFLKAFLLFFICSTVFTAGYKSEKDMKTRKVTAPPKSLEIDPFYKKYVSAEGLPIVSSEKVSDQALLEAANLVNRMLADRPDIRQALIKADVRVGVMHPTEMTTDIPEHSQLKPKDYWDRRARGLGGRVTTCGEENLLGLQGDRYYNENILIHEFAHCIHGQWGKRVDKNFDTTLKQLYEKAMNKGLWKDTYAGSNYSEYWAEGVQSWYDTNRQIFFDDTNRAHYRDHNHVDTREELEAYDPDLAKLIAETFNHTDRTDWRYQPLVTAVPESLDLDPFYKKYVNCKGLPIISSEKVSDHALLEVDNLINRMLAERSDLHWALKEDEVSIVVMHPTEKTTDIPEYRHMEPKEYWDKQVRGHGGRVTLCPEENLLNYSGDRYADENIFIHEFAQTLYDIGLRRMDKNFERKLKRLYKKAMEKGLWKDTPAEKAHSEYWAEGVQSWFDANHLKISEGNLISTREQLEAYDPDLAKLIAGIFRNVDWRYQRPDKRKQK